MLAGACELFQGRERGSEHGINSGEEVGEKDEPLDANEDIISGSLRARESWERLI
jgi:hypothetical protein